MRLCFVGSIGSVHTERWIGYFAKNGHEVHLLAPAHASGLGMDGVTLHSFRTFRTRIRPLDLILNSLIALPQALWFRALIRRLSPDVVHAQYINDAALYAALSGFHPFVVTAWGSDVLIGPMRSMIHCFIARYVLRKADLITCDADHMKQALVRLGADPARVSIIHFGTDTEEFTPQRRDPRLRKELGLDQGPVVLSTRRLEPIYDVETFVRAIPLVLRRMSEVRFVIAGSGSEEPRLRAMAESLGVKAAVQFVGRLSPEELPRYVASADIYVSTALSDGGLASSTAEAMACGLPVIVTDVGDNRLWVEDGVNGFVIPPRDPEALASRIVHLGKHEGERKRFGRVGRGIIEGRNRWQTEMERMRSLYSELVMKFQVESRPRGDMEDADPGGRSGWGL